MHEPEINPGARPAGETTEAAAAQQVRGIFDAIAPTYDLANHILTFGIDRHWWRRSARAFRHILQRPEARILDLCCGTGDMTAALLAERPSVPARTGCPGSGLSDPGSHTVDPLPQIEPITGLDFSPHMLAKAHIKYPQANIVWVEGDAMHLPYPDNSFDLVTAAFGFRNLTNYAAGLAEMHRVLRPGGQLGILECNQPSGLTGFGYNLFFRYLVPVLGGLISGDRAAYKYLPASVARFPRPPQMLSMLAAAGFTEATWTGYLLRAAGLYRATKS